MPLEGGRAVSRESHRETPRFRPIHYLGSKLRALDPILRTIDQLDPSRGPLCDLFAGSGTVAYAASHSRKVVAVDIQRYSETICKALLGPAPTVTGERLRRQVLGSELLAQLRQCARPLLDLEERALELATRGNLELMAEILEEGALVRLEYGHVTSSRSVRAAQTETASRMKESGIAPVCLRHFGGVFYSYSQALMIDAIASAARLYDQDREPIVAALLTAMSESVNTVGKQFAQPLRLRSKAGHLKAHLRAKVIADRAIDPLAGTVSAVDGYRCLLRATWGSEVICDDFRDALPRLKGKVSLVYADPPYTRDHYSRYYHVLETVAVGDDPEIAMSNLGGGKLLSRGLYRADRHQSDFCIRSKAPDAFRTLFTETRRLGVPLLLSYSNFDSAEDAHPRVLSVRDVKALAEAAFSIVSVAEVDLFNYSKLNHGSLHKGAEGTKEILISCRSG